VPIEDRSSMPVYRLIERTFFMLAAERFR
jgi:hypothetical protein